MNYKLMWEQLKEEIKEITVQDGQIVHVSDLENVMKTLELDERN